MRLLRSEEPAEPARGRLSLATLDALARDWYGDRLSPSWRPRTIDEAQRILEAHGLIGEHWRLQ